MIRWSEAELNRYLQHGSEVPLTEKAWQGAVLRLLRQYGYAFLYHTFDSRRSPSGFPDIIALHELPGKNLLALELKTDTGQVTNAQAAWLAALAGCTEVVPAVWRPQDIQAIIDMLKQP